MLQVPIDKILPVTDARTNISKLVDDVEKNIYIGVLYENKEKQNFMEVQKSRDGSKTELVDEVEHFDVTELMPEWRWVPSAG